MEALSTYVIKKVLGYSRIIFCLKLTKIIIIGCETNAFLEISRKYQQIKNLKIKFWHTQDNETTPRECGNRALGLALCQKN